ncbi:MAG: TM2 domain-containing protein [Gloeomargarita sp. SKYG116]|nr:TM2 domain-containing protein [Gloeomargarita sp. SKYG116]MDW8401200.1 TM2 domain-containing protein [Gloeomargarita sp. SKYGB_i_bin116]
MSPAAGYVLRFSSQSAAALVAGLQDWQERGLWEGATLNLAIIQREARTIDLTLNITTTAQIPRVIQGMKTWAELGLVTAPVEGKVVFSQLPEQLLGGLERWLQLGLLSDKQLAWFCQDYLTQPLREIPSLVEPRSSRVTEPGRLGGAVQPLSVGTAYLLWALGFVGLCGLHRLYLGQIGWGLLWFFSLGLCGIGQLVDILLIPYMTRVANQRRGVVSVVTEPVASIAQPPALLQSLQTELSILWLGLVGVFLVVLSSVVLVVSVWDVLGRVGQYALLALYTLAFGGLTWRLQRTNRVPLTTTLLQSLTLLLIPINFWAMDGLGLWQEQLAVAIGSGLILTGLGWWLLGQNRSAGVALALAWLQSYWPQPVVIYGAVYLGVGLATAVLLRQRRWQWPEIAVAGSVGLLLVRAIGTLGWSARELALAVGGSGGLLVLLGPQWVGWPLAWAGWLWASWGAEWAWSAAGMVLVLGALIYRWVRQTRARIGIWGLGLLQLQAWWLLWTAIPATVRDAILTTAERVGGTLGMPTVLLSVLWLPALGVVLAVSQWWERRGNADFARDGRWFALALGAALCVLSLANPTWRVLLWGGCALYLWGWGRGQPAVHLGWVYLGQALTWSAVLFAVDRLAPELPSEIWALLLFIGAAGEWCWCCTEHRWRQTGWPVGLVLMALGYGQWLMSSPNAWLLGGLLPPLALSILAWQPPCPLPRWWLGISTVSAGLVALWMPDEWRTLALGLAAVITAFNAWQWPNGLTGWVTLSLGWWLWLRLIPDELGVITTLLETGFLLLVWAGRHYLALHRELYAWIADDWAAVVSGGLLFGAVYTISPAYTAGVLPDTSTVVRTLAGLGIVNLGLAYRLYQRGQGWVGWMLVLGLEAALGVGAVLATADRWLVLALGNTVLGLVALVLLRRQLPSRWVMVIPLFYVTIGLVVGLGTPLTDLTGWTAVGFGLVVLSIQRWRSLSLWLTYTGWGAISLGLYQFLVYWLLQQPAGQPGDGWMALAALAMLLSYAYVGLQRWGARVIAPAVAFYLGHAHWGLAVLLAAIRLGFPTSRSGVVGNAIVLLLCSVYALGYGRHQGAWVWAGAAIFLAAVGDILMVLVAETTLAAWAGTMGSLLGLFFVSAPWERWGWPEKQRWQAVGWAVPGGTVLLLGWIAGGNWVTWPNLLVTAAFYAWAAKDNLRWSYVSLLLLDWGLFKFLREQDWSSFLAYALIIGLSMLYVAQVDVYWRQADTREERHALRCWATGLIGATLIWETQGAWGPGLLTMALGLALAGLGLWRRVRAYLWVGTLVFALQALIQVWMFVTTHSFFIWVLGLAAGVVLLWMAATFETRRAQVRDWLQALTTLITSGWAGWE